MKRTKTILFLLFSFFYSISTQAQYTISVFVKASDSKEPLANAIIFDIENFQSVLTNEYGFFSISINNENTKLTASYVGYQTLTKELKLTNDTTVNFFLSTTSLEEIKVVAHEIAIQNNQLGRNTIPIANLARVPSLLGEPDILKSMSILAGVSLGSEGNSNLFVRGGTPDQNLMLLDGIPVYNATHLFGFFSVFNSEALDKVDLIKGGFPARYGGRLSSIIDVKMKEGSTQKRSGSFGIGLLTSSLKLEGPIKENKSSFLLATRASYLGLINLFMKKEEQRYYTDYWLYDVNAKTNFLLPKGKLIFSFYHGNDYETDASNGPTSTRGTEVLESTKTDDVINWGNTIFSSKYITSLNSSMLLSVTGGYTRYKFNSNSETEKAIYGDIDTLIQNKSEAQRSNLSDFILKGQIDFTPKGKHQFQVGTSLIFHSFNIENSSEKATGSSNSEFRLRNFEATGYIENFTQWNKRFTTNVGIHWNGYFAGGKNFYSLQPRFLSKYQISKKVSLQFAYATMQQNIHLLTNSGFSFPSDIWIPATQNVAPAESSQVDLGVFFNVKNIFHFSIEAFYKRQSGLIEFENNETSIIDNIDQWESLVLQNGSGNIKGLEFMVRKSVGKWQGLLSYTLSKNERQFAGLNFGKSYLFRYHRPHDFNINLIFSPNSKWSFSTNWIYQSGRRVTLPIGVFPSAGADGRSSSLFFGERNNSKFPDYHRMDVAVIYTKQKKKEREAQWIFNIYNLYNRQNTTYLSFDSRGVFDDQQNYLYNVKKVNSVSTFSIIPSLSYKYKF